MTLFAFTNFDMHVLWSVFKNSLFLIFFLKSNFLHKFFNYSWRSLCLGTNERSKIPLRNIVKTFSSGKPERMVHKCLTDLGLAGDKVYFVIHIHTLTFSQIFFVLCTINYCILNLYLNFFDYFVLVVICDCSFL